MKKKILTAIVLATLLASCGGKSDKEKELELRERELALKEKELGIDNGSNSSGPTTKQQDYTPPKKKTEAELKQELYERECSRATELLTGNLKITPKYKNALSMKVNGLKLNCTITNKATIATFKNIKARADFKSKTGTLIFSKTFDIYEFISPKGNINYKSEFEVTNQQYVDIANFTWTILDATCR